MPRFIPPDGANPCRLFICGERPGKEEYSAMRGFVGSAGDELWQRLWKVCRIERRECWTTNLVKTFSTEPPTFREIARDAPQLRRELRTVESFYDSVLVIVTIGYHAARWFLPQFHGVRGDFFHGLTYATKRDVRYNERNHPPLDRKAIVIPCCHSAAALRQPEIYQNQFTADLRAVGDLVERLDLERQPRVHVARTPLVFNVGLATPLSVGRVPLAIDSEGRTPRHTECFTVANSAKLATCIETYTAGRNTPGLDHLGRLIAQSSTLVSHHAKIEMQALNAMRVPYSTVDCTMLMAYELGLAQSLKVLAYRLKGYVMREFEDLITPLDDRLVGSALEASHAEWHRQFFGSVETWRQARDAYQAARKRAGTRPRAAPAREWQTSRAQTRTAIAPHGAKGTAYGALVRPGKKPAVPSEVVIGGQRIPRRAVSSIARILKTEGEKSKRDRWEGSKFAPLAPLPPVPTWKDVPHAKRVPYALTDAIAHRAVYRTMLPRLDAEQLTRIYRIDRGVLPFLVRNEEVGLKVDVSQLDTLHERFQREYADVLDQLETIAGHRLNPLASEDVSDTMFDEWDVQPTRMLKSGYYTTEDKYLKARKDQHEGVPLVIEARQINKMDSTYVRRLPHLLRRGRYHPNWKYTRTASGRAAEEIILLIPKHSERGQAIRRAFVADDGCVLVSVDLSQIEMRVMAHESRDEKFLHNYLHGIDMHSNTAHEMLGAPREKDKQDESLHRLPAKTFNFSVLMGTTEYGLADQLQEKQLKWVVELTAQLKRQGFKSTREFLTEWFKIYPGVATWIRQQKAHANKYGWVRDMYGRKINVSGVWSTNDWIREEWERKAHAIPIQSGAQGTAKKWIALIDRYILQPMRETKYYCEPWVWIHDDVTLCVDTRKAPAVAKQMLSMVPQDLCVPSTADAKAGFNWANFDKKKPALNPHGLGSVELSA